MSLSQLKNRLHKAASKFATLIESVYHTNSHSILTSRGMKIPTVQEITSVINGLIDGIKEDTISASSAGIQIEIDRDEDGNILDGSIGYVCDLYTLLGENEDVLI
jgi:hypothetical protein